MTAPRTRSAVLLAALFLSGFSALVYEVSWSRMLGLALGGTVVSATIVLMAFMAGLAAGSMAWGWLADRWDRPARLFGICQLAIVLGTVLSYALIALIPRLFTAQAPPFMPYLLATTAVFAAASAIGGAYPLFAKAYIQDSAGIGRGVGVAGALDALGSAAGGLAAGFVLLGTLGQWKTLALAAALNLAAGIAALVLSRGTPIAAAKERIPRPQPKQDHNSPIMILAVAGLAGLAGMALQVVWIRILKIFLPNTSYSFSLVAGVLILGLGAGSGLYYLLVPRIRRPLVWLAAVQLAGGAFLFASSLVLDKLPALVLFPLAGALGTPGLRIFLPPVALSLSLILLPAACSGFTFPLLCSMFSREIKSLGSGIGLVRLWNAAGSVAGPALAAFLLIPLAGVAKSVQILALVSLAVAAWAAWCDRTRPGKRMQWPSLAACIAGLLLVVLAPRVQILPPSFYQGGQRDARVIQYRETVEGTVTVSEDARTGIRACYVNNSGVVGTTYDAIKAVKLLGHLPFLLGAEPREVLVVGFGIGVTTATIASHPEVRRIDCVEIAPGVRDAARYFTEYNRGVALSPQVSFIAGDGRAFMARARKTYDLISADPTHPTLGCANLYTSEYFRLCRARLKPEGYICQYLPLHGLTPREFAGIVGTFRAVFPHATVWLGHSHCVLLGAASPLAVDFNSFAARVKALDDPLFYKDPYSVAACLMLDETGASAVSRGAMECGDDRNYLDFFDSHAKDQANWERNIDLLVAHLADLRRVFTGADTAVLARYEASRAAFIAGQRLQNRGKEREAIELFRQAVELNPANQEYRFLYDQEARQGR
jgi:spermidine synthase/MFS family permease